MLDEKLPTTLQYQLKQELLGRIRGGDWPSGARISSEREICEEYGVSRITVREVLKDLVQNGHLIRKQGKGTFVASTKLEQKLSSFYSFSEEIKKMGLTHQTRVLDFRTAIPDVAVRRKLSLAESGEVFCIVRLRLVDEEPFAWEESFVPCAMAQGLIGADVEKYGLYKAIRELSGIVLDEAEESFEAVACPSQAAQHLGIKRDAAVLRLERMARAEGVPVEFCNSFIRSDKYKYKILLK